MGTVIRFPQRRHARASNLKAKTAGSTSLPESLSAALTSRKYSWGIRRRERQLLTTGALTPSRPAASVVPPRALITSSTELSMLLDSSRPVKMSSLHASAVEAVPLVMSDMPMADQLKAMARRLKMTREALDLSAADLCKLIDCAPNRWSQYESGKRAITVPVAIAMCDQFGLSLDWIYRADPSQIPTALRLKMRQAA